LLSLRHAGAFVGARKEPSAVASPPGGPKSVAARISLPLVARGAENIVTSIPTLACDERL
jgi:hypothetical protein